MKFEIKNYNMINNKIINDDIFQLEKVNYSIIERDDQIDHLIDWISETKNNNDKELMKNDLKYLLSLKDKYILSSILTNEYIREKSKEGQEILKEIYFFKN